MSDLHVEEISDLPAPNEALARVRDLPYPLLLHSVARSPEQGRYSFLAADPAIVLRSKNGSVSRTGSPPPRPGPSDPWDAVRGVLAEHFHEPASGLPPFQGGVAGFFSYDLCRQIERIPPHRFDDLALPDLCVGVYDWVVSWDHLRGTGWLVSTGAPATASSERAARAARRGRMVRRRLARPSSSISCARATVPPGASPPHFPVPGIPGVLSTASREGYLGMVERTREYIRAGDIFQANVSQRLQAPWSGDALALYRRLCERNPAPFSAFLDIGEAAIVSASPERFLRLQDGRVETRPIKGTAPRGATAAQDRALAAALSRSDKDRAENVMIVDLLRNDLSRVCSDDSIVVPELCAVETHPTVHHLVSTVVGELKPGRDAVDLLRAAFPGGSITGAPKVRAMEIIAELEPTQRGVYTGAIGYLGFEGGMDTSIAIRTLVVRGERAYFQVGGGIVIDSDPEREYEETLYKAGGMLAALAEELA